MRTPALLLLLVSLSLASSYGYSRLYIERTWNITSNAPFEFTGSLAVNDSNQRVVSVTTEPEMNLTVDGNGTVGLFYAGNGSIVLKATALVDVDYSPEIGSDSPVPGTPLASTPLTEADGDIALEASMLADEGSSLKTIRNLVNWVHDDIQYDISYWGQEKSAKDVFRERRGVCVEYTHLLISMARSLGFETRYVSGYELSGTWQPHAWAEIYVPGYGWLAADPTFGQAGVLDDTHLAVRKSDDQSGAFDILLSRDENVSITAVDMLDSRYTSEDPKNVSAAMDFDSASYVAEVTLSNGAQDYAFGSYSFVAPQGYGGEQTSVVLLGPGETLRLYHGLNHSLFQRGFYYTIPLAASFNDAKASENLTVNALGVAEGAGASSSSSSGTSQPCAASLAPGLIVICALGFALTRR